TYAQIHLLGCLVYASVGTALAGRRCAPQKPTSRLTERTERCHPLGYVVAHSGAERDMDGPDEDLYANSAPAHRAYRYRRPDRWLALTHGVVPRRPSNPSPGRRHLIRGAAQRAGGEPTEQLTGHRRNPGRPRP